MTRILIRMVILAGLVLCYQNCAPMEADLDPAGDRPSEIVKASTSLVERVIYDPQLEMSSATPQLVIDRMMAEMTLSVPGTASKTCTLDPLRRSDLESLLEGGKVCTPGPLPPDTVVCMAIGLTDIRLEAGGDVMELRPVICHNGTFLCDGRDEKFRALLTDLVATPPAGCL